MANGKFETLRDGKTSVSVRPRLFEFLDCETKIETPKRLCRKIETATHTEPLRKRDCETCEIRLKFSETHIFLKTIRHPSGCRWASNIILLLFSYHKLSYKVVCNKQFLRINRHVNFGLAPQSFKLVNGSYLSHPVFAQLTLSSPSLTLQFVINQAASHWDSVTRS